MDYCFLDGLNKEKDTWMIKARVCRMWQSTNPKKNNELISTDMILLDEKENLIHAVIRKHLTPRFEQTLREGALYSIRNLKVVENTGMYRPLSCRYKVLFLATTAIQNLDEDVVTIPLQGFQFVCPETIDSRINDATILTDVVGCLRGGRDSIDVVGGGWNKRDLKILTNHSKNCNITLWGKQAELFDPNLYNKDGGPYVIIVTSTTIKKFQGELSFGTTSASKIYINLDTPFVKSLRERFATICNNVEFTQSSPIKKRLPEEEMFIHRMSIKELVDTKWDSNLEEYIATVRARIAGIDNTFGWNYISCKVCLKKVITTDATYRCNSCQKTIDYPLVMFKIHVKVKDESGETTFVLFNVVAERLLDMSAKKLFNKLSSNESVVPEEIKTLMGKDLVFKLRLNSYNLKEGYSNFTVSEVFEPSEKLEKEYKAKIFPKNDNLEELPEQKLANVHDCNIKKRKAWIVDDDDENEPAQKKTTMEGEQMTTSAKDQMTTYTSFV